MNKKNFKNLTCNDLIKKIIIIFFIWFLIIFVWIKITSYLILNFFEADIISGWWKYEWIHERYFETIFANMIILLLWIITILMYIVFKIYKFRKWNLSNKLCIIKLIITLIFWFLIIWFLVFQTSVLQISVLYPIQNSKQIK